MVTAKDATAIGSQVQVDQGLCHQLPILIGSGLEGDQRVDVHCPDGQPVGAGVVRVCGGASGARHRVLVVAPVARAGLGEPEGDPDGGDEAGVGRGVDAQQAANVSKEPLQKRERVFFLVCSCVFLPFKNSTLFKQG